MKAYFAFTQKEILESIRTYKLLIMAMVFIFFGIFGPLTAKLTPKILGSLMPAGIEVTITETTAFDSWAQFFKNVSQMGFIVMAILFSGIMANEFNRGTLINVLTKGLARRTVILSKFTVAFLIWTVSYLLCFILSYIYTQYYWKSDGILNLSFSVFYLWIFGVMLISIIILGGVIFRSSYGCLMFTGGFIAILFLLNIVAKFNKYNPIGLATKNMSLLTGDVLPKDLRTMAIMGIGIIFFSLLFAMGIFNKKEI